jgi:hypothetical protein
MQHAHLHTAEAFRVVSLSPRRPGFGSRPVNEGFMVDKAKLENIFHISSNNSILFFSVSFYKCSIVIFNFSTTDIIQSEHVRPLLHSISLSYVYDTPQRDRSVERKGVYFTMKSYKLDGAKPSMRS